MPSIVSLPTRANALVYDDDTIEEVLDLLGEVEKGQGVVVDDDPQETDGKARTRARVMVEALMRATEDRKFRTHAVETEDGKFYAVVSERPAKEDSAS